MNTAAMADMHQDQQFLETVVKAIVNKPELVRVERTVDELGVLLTLHVDPSDMGFVIGQRGRMAQALRILLKGVGAKSNARINMKIYEPEDARRAHQETKVTPRHGDAGLVTDEDLNDLGI